MTSATKRPLDEEGVVPLSRRIDVLPATGDRMAGRRTLLWIAVATAALPCVALLASGAFGADTFRRLSGKDIAARVTGMELTDGVHWAYVFQKGGRLTSVSMGKSGGGTWRVQGNELCRENGRRETCEEVWTSGAKVQLRTPGRDIFDEGILRKPPGRGGR